MNKPILFNAEMVRANSVDGSREGRRGNAKGKHAIRRD